MVMAAMPVQSDHLLVGAVFHLAFSMALGAAFGLAIALLSRTGLAAATKRLVLMGAAGALAVRFAARPAPAPSTVRATV